MSGTTLLSHLKHYLNKTEDDWNYITPLDYYNKYFLKNKKNILIDLR